MTNRHDDDTLDAGRRRLLGGMATTGALLALGGLQEVAAEGKKASSAAPGGKELDALLDKHIQSVVVIYAENRSFNNLFANFPGATGVPATRESRKKGAPPPSTTGWR